MTISSALANAMTGLRAAGRSSETISANIANTMTPGYGVRSVSLSSAQMGGVSIDGILRNVDPGVVSDRRLASAAATNSRDVNTFLTKLENYVGTPDEDSSLAARIAQFESSLVTAASRPDAPERLDGVANAAYDITVVINKAAEGIQKERSEADRKIGIQVDRLNSALEDVQGLNQKITKAIILGNDPSALMDNRQVLVDEIGSLVSIRQVPRDNGKVALYSIGGAILLDSSPAKVEFTAVNQVTPYSSLTAGTLSGITINGITVRTDSERGALLGGSISAQFEIRDELAPEAQTQIDAFARDLIERFQDPSADPTLSIGDPGLFTDNSSAFTSINEVGISNRLSLNGAVDKRQGGETWRVRDGMNAIAPGDVGNSGIIQMQTSVLKNTRVPLSGNFGAGAFSVTSLLASLTSKIGADRVISDQKMTFSTTQYDEITQQLLADGVDTDSEMQRLLIVEQAYAANARIIQAADDMMQQILRL